MINEGRFFPGVAVYGLMVWKTLATRLAYALYLILLNGGLILACGVTVSRLVRNRSAGVVVALALAGGMMMRDFPWDGFFNMGGLVAWSLLMTILCCVGAVRFARTGYWLTAAVTVFAWVWVITAYEVSFLMLPAMLAVIFVTPSTALSARLKGMALLVVPWLIDGAFVLHLRRAATGHTNAAYTIDLGGPVIATFEKQFVAALPLSQYWYGGLADWRAFDWLFTALLLGAVAVPLIVTQWRRTRDVVRIDHRVTVALLMAGAWAWLVPSILAAITVRWQQTLPAGAGYIYVVYSSFGVALIVGAIYAALRRPAASSCQLVIARVLVGVVCVVAVLCAAANIQFAARFVPPPFGPG